MTDHQPARTPMEWAKAGTGRWTSVGADGTDWEIVDDGPNGPKRFAITIARWDRPDWWAPTLNEAQLLAAEIDARPPIPPEERITEGRAVMPPPGDEHVPYPTATAPPSGPCECGSLEVPAAVKPRALSSAWWDDPSAFWKCPACDRYRCDVE